MADMLYVDAPPAGHTALTDWIRSHADTLGRSYTSYWQGGKTKYRRTSRIETIPV